MHEIEALYRRLIDAWNARDGGAMAAVFASNGEMIGFDGSHVMGRAAIAAEMAGIFADHETARYVTKVKDVRELAPSVEVLRAIAGMVPPSASELNPDVNTHQTLVATRSDDGWSIDLFQNTPAQFHGRPELKEAMTAELRAEL